MFKRLKSTVVFMSGKLHTCPFFYPLMCLDENKWIVPGVRGINVKARCVGLLKTLIIADVHVDLFASVLCDYVMCLRSVPT